MYNITAGRSKFPLKTVKSRKRDRDAVMDTRVRGTIHQGCKRRSSLMRLCLVCRPALLPNLLSPPKISQEASSRAKLPACMKVILSVLSVDQLLHSLRLPWESELSFLSQKAGLLAQWCKVGTVLGISPWTVCVCNTFPENDALSKGHRVRIPPTLGTNWELQDYDGLWILEPNVCPASNWLCDLGQSHF